MDCVTCLLVGMCMLCGQNLGGSRLQGLATSEAASSGRPMTRAEVDTALQSAIRHLNSNVVSSSNSYLRQSKLDPRFSHMGIGKRYGIKLDPYNFVAGLGKRAQASQDVEEGGVPDFIEDASRSQSRVSSYGDSTGFNLKPISQEASYSYAATNPFIFSNALDRSRQVTDPEDWESSSSETRKLRLRRMQLRLHPTMALLTGAREQL